MGVNAREGGRQQAGTHDGERAARGDCLRDSLCCRIRGHLPRSTVPLSRAPSALVAASGRRGPTSRAEHSESARLDAWRETPRQQLEEPRQIQATVVETREQGDGCRGGGGPSRRVVPRAGRRARRLPTRTAAGRWWWCCCSRGWQSAPRRRLLPRAAPAPAVPPDQHPAQTARVTPCAYHRWHPPYLPQEALPVPTAGGSQPAQLPTTSGQTSHCPPDPPRSRLPAHTTTLLGCKQCAWHALLARLP